jgi:hypothetical protein
MRMNINVYLPNELAERAKAADLPFSRLLRAAVRGELERRTEMSNTLQNSYESFIDLEDENGRRYQGKIVGKLIASDSKRRVYLTNDERVLVYEADELRYWEAKNPVADLRLLEGRAYFDAMHGIGESPIVEL